MVERPTSPAVWTDGQIAQTRRWAQTWKRAGPELERIRREELRRLDVPKAIALLCGTDDYRVSPRVAKPTSGLIEQQRVFGKLRRK